MSEFHPLAAALAKEQSADLAFSALPHAPVLPDAPDRGPRRPSVRAVLAARAPRLRLAAALHRLAAVVEPAPQCRPAR